MEDKLLYANLLILLQNFENLWNMYSVSEGVLYRNETKESAKQYLDLFHLVSIKDSKIRNSKDLTINSINNTDYIDNVNKALEEWVERDKPFPISSNEIGIGDNEKSRLILQPVFMCLSVYLLSIIKFDYLPVLCKSSGEGAFHKNNIKWNGRFPWQISDQVDKKLLGSLSDTETVVIIGDIRKSQDLVTYAVTPDTYRTNMIALIEMVRKTVLDNMGVFDRFTGDGFICYFNSHLSKMFHKDLYESVIDVCVKIQNESKPLFEEWKRTLQKLPQESIGLSIGIDSGKMNFLDDSMMFAIGTPAVWAARMCAAGKAGDIIMNNIPHSIICNSKTTHCFDELLGTTKTGEQFLAYKLRYED